MGPHRQSRPDHASPSGPGRDATRPAHVAMRQSANRPVAPPGRTAKLPPRPPTQWIRTIVQATDTTNPDYFHRVVDCQWACPAHTDVPEYIRLIALGRFSDAYMVNRESNVFPGILGRVCDRPCEPACRRGRVEDKPVAICRLKRVAADHKDDDRRPPAGRARTEERQARGLHRRRPRLAHGRQRPAAARLRGRDLRAVGQAGRPDAHQHPVVPPARGRARRGNRLHHRDGRRDPLRLARREPEEAARDGRLRRGVRRQRRAQGQGARSFPAARKAARTSTSASTGSSRSRSSTSTRSASRC